MTFNDIFKSSFLENVTQFSAVDTLIGMFFALVIGLFIFVVYKKTFNGVMYSSGGQIDGIIPATDEEQRADTTKLVDASEIDISVMGIMDMGGEKSARTAGRR